MLQVDYFLMDNTTIKTPVRLREASSILYRLFITTIVATASLDLRQFSSLLRNVGAEAQIDSTLVKECNCYGNRTRYRGNTGQPS